MDELVSRIEIGRRLKKLRCEHHLSQQQFAERLGLTRGNYAQIEMGKQFPSYDVLITLSAQFNKSYEWLLHGFDSSEVAMEIMGESAVVVAGDLQSPLKRPLKVFDEKGVEKSIVVSSSQHSNYAANLQNGSFLDLLPVFDLSFRYGNEVTYRGFEVEGNGIDGAFAKGDLLIAKPLEDLNGIKSSLAYVVVCGDGLRFMIFSYLSFTEGMLVGSLGGDSMDLVKIPIPKVVELWEVADKLTSRFWNTPEAFRAASVGSSLQSLRHDVEILKNKSSRYQLG